MNNKHTQRKWWLIGTMVLACAAVVWFVVRTPAYPVESALVDQAALRITIEEDGRTRTTDRYVVTAPLSGRLQRIGLREGEHIRAGQTLAHIEPLPHDPPARAEAEARLGEAQARQRAAGAELAQAVANHEQATRELTRRRQLVEAGALSTEQIERYELAARSAATLARSARESVAVADAEIAAARQALAARRERGGVATVIRAPADGVVLRIPEYSARIVAAGQPLLELGALTTLEAVIDVLTVDAVRIRPGMPVQLTGWGGEPLSGRVRKIEPSAFTRTSALGVEEQRVNVLVDFDACPETLGDGYRIESSITVWAAERVLVVPNVALFRAADGWRTFVIEQGRARLRPVQIGQRGQSSSEVLAGLKRGERVILFPGDDLADGVRVGEAGKD